jgi:hypothetical protein
VADTAFPETVFEPAPRVWGVGRVVVGGEVTPWPVSRADIEDEAAAMAPRLDALGLRDGGLVLIVSLLSQAIHVAPFEQAAGLVGARFSSADATPFDAFRTASLIRQLHPGVVMGVDGAVLDGLAEQGRDLAEVFGTVGAVVAADAGAADRLRAAGLAPRRWVKLGPTSAVQGLDGDDLVYDPTRWQVDAEPGTSELLITNLADRLTPCDRFATGERGTVIEPGRLALSSG